MAVKMPPVSVIIGQLGLKPNGKVQSFFTDTCYRYMDKYVPMDKGHLRDEVDIQPNMITYEQEYASYQYYGMREDGTHKINPDNYTTPGTGTYWDRRMVSNEMSDVIKEVQRYIDRGAK